jgi:hypothetical protein
VAMAAVFVDLLVGAGLEVSGGRLCSWALSRETTRISWAHASEKEVRAYSRCGARHAAG